jgi:hypothetical protein
MGQRLDSGGKGEVRAPFLCHEALFYERRGMGLFIRRTCSLLVSVQLRFRLKKTETSNP